VYSNERGALLGDVTETKCGWDAVILKPSCYTRLENPSDNEVVDVLGRFPCCVYFYKGFPCKFHAPAKQRLSDIKICANKFLNT
jgi:hypothetical protein